MKLRNVIEIKDRAELAKKWQMIREAILAFVDSGGGALQLLRDLRNLKQNEKMWPMLNDFAEQTQWAGAKRSKEDWKVILLSAWRVAEYGENPNIIPGLEGEIVALSYRTSKLSKKDFCSFIEYIYWQGSQFKIRWSEKAAAAYDSYPEAV